MVDNVYIIKSVAGMEIKSFLGVLLWVLGKFIVMVLCLM
jgi:hypothetical protein